jgi:hypothetical protein
MGMSVYPALTKLVKSSHYSNILPRLNGVQSRISAEPVENPRHPRQIPKLCMIVLDVQLFDLEKDTSVRTL